MTAIILSLAVGAPLPPDREPDFVPSGFAWQAEADGRWRPSPGRTRRDGSPLRVLRLPTHTHDPVREIDVFHYYEVCDDPACGECRDIVYYRRRK